MKNRLCFLGTVLMVSLLIGCGGSSKETAASTMAMDMAVTEEAAEEAYYAADEMMEMESGDGGVTTNSEISDTAQTGRKLIRTFDITIQTKEFDSVLSGIQTKIQELGGYIETSSLDGGSAYYSSYNRYSYMTVRIPSDQLDHFVETVKESANVTYISESTEDITLKYVDTESRKIALETERDRLLELLEKAETVEDIITIESRLSEVRYQLESYASQLRTYDNQVDYSTVYINISEVDRETKVEPKNFWEEVAEEFGDSLYGIGRDCKNFAIWFLGSSPYIVLWAVGIGIVVLVIKIIGKKNTMKKTLKTMKTEEQDEANN
ncbi:MAG: DUF4349 domain-containing protein [Lachnospiraceae bacterium]|nr:DUF4349 domain-containing protein [Lachnospiraceae bacterium]